MFGGIFAVIDTALKASVSHDSTAVLYCAYQPPTHLELQKVFIVDYDIRQIHGSLLIDYLPEVHGRLEELIREHKAKWGNLGIFVEDKGSGTVLLGQSIRTGIETKSIPSHITALGKDDRAMAASPYIAGRQIKISQYAYNKMIDNKGSYKNHLLSQIMNFRIADKASYSRSDDLLDTLTYAAILACGSGDHF